MRTVLSDGTVVEEWEPAPMPDNWGAQHPQWMAVEWPAWILL